jgi:hypothetical protein
MIWWGWLLLGVFIGANVGLLVFAMLFQKGGFGRRKGDVVNGGDSKISGTIR